MTGTPREPRQRWRVVFRRSVDAPPLIQREWIAAWESGLVASGLPLTGLDGPAGRPKLAFGAPLAERMAAERELLDIVLTERRPITDVRAGVARALPDGIGLVDLHDVWLGEAPLAAQVVAAVYRLELQPAGPRDTTLDARAVAQAAADLLAAGTLPRQRVKGGGTVAYDLRPLLVAIDVEAGRAAIAIRMVTRFDPVLGTGRPDEVVAALAERAGVPLEIVSITRERLNLAGESGAATGP